MLFNNHNIKKEATSVTLCAVRPMYSPFDSLSLSFSYFFLFLK